jgi:amino acid transporter
MDKKPALKKQLSPLSVWALAFGCVIGWGAFINPGKKFLFNSGVAGTAIAMVLGALVMVIIAFSYAYMVPKYPKAGGEFDNISYLSGEAVKKVANYLTDGLLNGENI